MLIKLIWLIGLLAWLTVSVAHWLTVALAYYWLIRLIAIATSLSL